MEETVIGIPLHGPWSGGDAMAVTQQGEIEDGAAGNAERRAGWEGVRRQRADAPARFRSTRLRRDAQARQHDHHAGLLGCEHEAARGLEVEGFRCAPDFADDGRHGRTLRGFDGGAQAGEGIARADHENAAGVETEGAQPIGKEMADFALGLVVLHPDDRARERLRLRCRLQRKRGRKAAGGGGIGLPLGDDLVQGGALQPAANGRIDRARVEGNEARQVMFGARRLSLGLFDFGQASPQRQELVSRRGHGSTTPVFVFCSCNAKRRPSQTDCMAIRGRGHH